MTKIHKPGAPRTLLAVVP